MTKLSAVIACADVTNTEHITDFLNIFGYDIIKITQYGFECINEVIENKPDVVICSSFMYDLDAHSVYNRLRVSGNIGNTVFVVASNVNDSSMINMLLGCGIDIFTLMPTDFAMLDTEIRRHVSDRLDVTCLKNENVCNTDEFDVMTYAKSLLHELGVCANVSGHSYIISSALIRLDNAKAEFTKVVYPLVAKKEQTSVSAVERAIRHAIEKSWQVGNITAIEDVFGYAYSSSSGRPTNAQYISMLVEKIKKHFKMK